MAPSQNIVMLAFPQAQLLDIAGPLQMFAGANDALGRRRTGWRSLRLRSVALPHPRVCSWWPTFRSER